MSYEANRTLNFADDVDDLLFVKLTAEDFGGEVCDTAGEPAFGILQDRIVGATSDKTVEGTVMRRGVSYLRLAAGVTGVTCGVKLTTDADGYGVIADTGDFVNAIALEAGEDGAHILVEIVEGQGY